VETGHDRNGWTADNLWSAAHGPVLKCCSQYGGETRPVMPLCRMASTSRAGIPANTRPHSFQVLGFFGLDRPAKWGASIRFPRASGAAGATARLRIDGVLAAHLFLALCQTKGTSE
jgi:hypothetical protein